MADPSNTNPSPESSALLERLNDIVRIQTELLDKQAAKTVEATTAAKDAANAQKDLQAAVRQVQDAMVKASKTVDTFSQSMSRATAQTTRQMQGGVGKGPPTLAKVEEKIGFLDKMLAAYEVMLRSGQAVPAAMAKRVESILGQLQETILQREAILKQTAYEKRVDAERDLLKNTVKLAVGFRDFYGAVNMATAGLNNLKFPVLGAVGEASPEVLKALGDAMKLLGASVGQYFLPAIRDVVTAVVSLAGWFNNLSPAVKDTLKTLGYIIVVVGVLLSVILALVSALASMALIVGGMVLAWRLIALASVIWGVSTMGVLRGLAGIVLLLGAVAAASYAVNKLFAGMSEQAQKVAEFTERTAKAGREFSQTGRVAPGTLAEALPQGVRERLLAGEGDAARQRRAFQDIATGIERTAPGGETRNLDQLLARQATITQELASGKFDEAMQANLRREQAANSLSVLRLSGAPELRRLAGQGTEDEIKAFNRALHEASDRTKTGMPGISGSLIGAPPGPAPRFESFVETGRRLQMELLKEDPIPRLQLQMQEQIRNELQLGNRLSEDQLRALRGPPNQQ